MATSYDSNNIFAKMLRGEIPCERVYENEHCLAFRDIQPQAPTHILLIPKAEIARLEDGQDPAVLGQLLLAAGEVARQEGLCEEGYRVVINSGAKACQTVFHLHLHLLAGRDMSWPPG